MISHWERKVADQDFVQSTEEHRTPTKVMIANGYVVLHRSTNSFCKGPHSQGFCL